MKRFEVTVKEELVNYIERLAFEVEGMKKVVKEIILDGQSNPLILEGEAFKKYEQRYHERNAAFEVAKTNLQNDYIPDDLQPLVTQWNLDYGTGVFSFEADVPDDYEIVYKEGN